MSEIAKFINIDIGDIAKIFGVEKANIAKVFGVDMPTAGGDRGIFGGGNRGGTRTNVIEYITISTPGNAQDFGDLTEERYKPGATSNGGSNRGLFASGYLEFTDRTNIIDYVTISTTGNAADFGDLTDPKQAVAGTSNNTNNRGVFAGGYVHGTGQINNIDYVTISTTGDALDFGDLTLARSTSATSNGTNNRGVFGAGWDDGHSNIIDYITISTTGNATDFGDLTTGSRLCATSNLANERGVFGGFYDGSIHNTIEYITISSPGNGTDFGDLTVGRFYAAATSNGVSDRGIFGGGYDNGLNKLDVIDYVTISTSGNATDFGDLGGGTDELAATSNA